MFFHLYASSSRWSVQCVLCAALCACSVDVAVYGSRLEPAGAGGAAAESGAGEGGRAGLSGGGGSGGDAKVFGCGGPDRTGPSILTDILQRLGGDLLSPEMTCETDADCSRTLISPRCDESRSVCMPCAGPLQQTDFGVRLGVCLASAGAICCMDPEAEPDCIVRACTIGCGGQ